MKLHRTHIRLVVLLSLELLLASIVVVCSPAQMIRSEGPTAASPTQTHPEPSRGGAGHPVAGIRFAVIGDYGSGYQAEADVATLVRSWNPDFIITLGDNNYPDGAASTIDQNIGQFYHEFIYPYTGAYGAGATTNRFFPSLGNHDWRSLTCTDNNCSGPYFDYFTLPGNERYYEFIWGPVHFFAIDSDIDEPDGTSETSTQAGWLQSALAASTTPWQLVYMHHPPFSSASHGSTIRMQWPYQAWGADVVIAGHDHTYERIIVDGLPYFVNGLGGKSRYVFGVPVAGSQVRYNEDYGAMLVEATEDSMTFQFISRAGSLIDTYTITKTTEPATTLERRIAASADDAEEWVSDGAMYRTSPALELTHDVKLEGASS